MQTVQDIKQDLFRFAGERGQFRGLNDQTGNVRAAALGMIEGSARARGGYFTDADFASRAVDIITAQNEVISELRASYYAETVAPTPEGWAVAHA